ncbi:hypothetical protein [Pseudoxanthomonas putridarboris]|uniref:hypothetical protein n=1 Tax=Pseudoxanthomonas putridarboris TaxID=752605 RepID=UPI00311D8386
MANANATSQGLNGNVVVEERDGKICFRIESYTEWKPSMFLRRLKRFDVDAGNVVIRRIYVYQRSGSTRSWVAVANMPKSMQSGRNSRLRTCFPKSRERTES